MSNKNKLLLTYATLLRRFSNIISTNMLIDLVSKNEYYWEKQTGSMAELVDAPDSKSGHFGGVGSIPSTPTKIILI